MGNKCTFDVNLCPNQSSCSRIYHKIVEQIMCIGLQQRKFKVYYKHPYLLDISVIIFWASLLIVSIDLLYQTSIILCLASNIYMQNIMWCNTYIIMFKCPFSFRIIQSITPVDIIHWVHPEYTCITKNTYSYSCWTMYWCRVENIWFTSWVALKLDA